MIENAIYHEGKVALRYAQPIPKYVRVGDKEYVCDVRRGVSMLLVEESEVPPLLNYLGGCCGGAEKNVLFVREGGFQHLADWRALD